MRPESSIHLWSLVQAFPPISGLIFKWQCFLNPYHQFTFPLLPFCLLQYLVMILSLLFGLALAYFGWSMFCLERNVSKARSMGVPVVRLPIDPVNFLWVFLQGHVWRMLDSLPIAWSSYPDFVRFTYRGWHFRAKSSMAVRLGPVWALVTPVTFYLQFADPDAVNQIFSRRTDFIRPVKNYSKPPQNHGVFSWSILLTQ